MTDALSNLEVRYVRPVEGELTREHFECVEAEMPAPRPGQILVRNVYLSLDPYQRRQMMPGVQYAQPLALGGVMTGRTVGRVLVSHDARFKPGAWVRGAFGWQAYTAVNASDAEAIVLDGFSPTAYLGVLGSPGLTAWVGLRAIARALADETVVVSAVTGAVGSVVAALASASDCRVLGIAGGPDKCAHAVKLLHCDACIDHRSPDFAAQLEAASPRGIDVDFENVGGAVFDQVLTRLNDFARVALCGLVSQYNLVEPYGMRNTAALLNKNVLLQGFRVSHYSRYRAPAYAEIKSLLREGKLRQDESIVQGLRNAPDACIGMLGGRNLGKQLVQIGPEED
ncbi:MAG: putative oxidoreductase YncB [Rhizobacter sp.]|nr:putative oxidoreductase YncB [Rhizobacter sp.]